MAGTVPLPNNHSLSSDEAVVVEVSLNHSSEQMKAVINKCWATPTQNSEDANGVTFLENRSTSTYRTIINIALNLWAELSCAFFLLL